MTEIIRTKTGYNWFLHDNIARNTADSCCRPEYDLCIIDGAKNWTSEGAAFFFVDKLLKPGGWIIFDDYQWSAAWVEQHEGRTATDGIANRALSQAEIETPQIREVLDSRRATSKLQQFSPGRELGHGAKDRQFHQAIYDRAP